MARNKKTENTEIELPEEVVWNMIDFARAQSGFMGVYTPDLVNQRMKDVTLNPLQVSQDNLDAAMADPKNHESDLQGFGQTFELQSMPYKRILAFLSDLPAFDLTYSCINTKDVSDYKSPAYQKDLKVVEKFLDCFDPIKEFRTVVRQLFRNEAYFCALRDDGDKFILQELPSNYCKITGRWDYGLLYSFNLTWFMQSGVDINMYPPFMKNAYDAYLGSAKTQGYVPSELVNLRGNNAWAQWVDLSPVDNFWAWKLSPEIATRVPYFAALYSDLILQPLIRNLQKNQYIAAAAKLVFGEVPMLSKEVKSSVKDSIAISPALLGQFLALIKAGLSEAIKVASAPLQNVQGISFPLDNNPMYASYLKTALATSGINTNLIFASDNKPNVVETQLSLNTDEQVIVALYPYFNAFMDYFVNRRTKKFKWHFEFEGSNFYTDRAARLENAMTLANVGIVLPQKISAAIGMNYHTFQRQLDEAKANGWVDKLTPIVSAFNMSKDAQNDGKGRPAKDDGDLSDSGSDTRDAGSNIAKGGKV